VRALFLLRRGRYAVTILWLEGSKSVTTAPHVPGTPDPTCGAFRRRTASRHQHANFSLDESVTRVYAGVVTLSKKGGDAHADSEKSDVLVHGVSVPAQGGGWQVSEA
jgi:hypothetical protein